MGGFATLFLTPLLLLNQRQFALEIAVMALFRQTSYVMTVMLEIK